MCIVFKWSMHTSASRSFDLLGQTLADTRSTLWCIGLHSVMHRVANGLERVIGLLLWDQKTENIMVSFERRTSGPRAYVSTSYSSTPNSIKIKIRVEKMNTKTDHALTSLTRCPNTQKKLCLNITLRMLSSVEHTLSKSCSENDPRCVGR